MRIDIKSCCRTVSLQLASTGFPAGPVSVSVEELSEPDDTVFDQCKVLLNGLRRANIVVGWISSTCSYRLSGRL